MNDVRCTAFSFSFSLIYTATNANDFCVDTGARLIDPRVYRVMRSRDRGVSGVVVPSGSGDGGEGEGKVHFSLFAST